MFTHAHYARFSFRIMEQENKKARDDARREYNDVVRVCRVSIFLRNRKGLLTQVPFYRFLIK